MNNHACLVLSCLAKYLNIRVLALEGDLTIFSYGKIFEYSSFGRRRRFDDFLIWQNIRIFEFWL